MNQEQSRAARLAELNRLHAAGDVSDSDYELLRTEILGMATPVERRRSGRSLLAVLALVALAAAGVAAYVLTSGGDAESLEEKGGSSDMAVVASTTPGVVTTTTSVAAASSSGSTTPTSPPLTPPPTVSADRREFIIEQAYVFIPRWVNPTSSMYGAARALDVRQGLLWAPNGLSSDEVMSCARARWEDFLGLRPRVERAADRALAESADPQKVTGVDVRDAFEPGLDASSNDADRTAVLTFFFECAGYSTEEARQLAER